MDGPLETSNEAGDDPSEAGFVVQATQLIDDMRGTAMRGAFGLTDGPGTSGEWYTYSDRTVPWSEPPIFLSDAGLLTPSDGVPFPATDDGASPIACGYGFEARVVFAPDWTQIRIPFGSMHPQGYSGSSTSAVPDVSNIYQLQFQIEAPVPPLDVAVAYIELYK